MANNDQPEYLIADEAAALARVPVKTLYVWRHNGTGPRARRVGKRLLYRRDELIAWIEAKADADDGADNAPLDVEHEVTA